jgi:hypothetical protein
MNERSSIGLGGEKDSIYDHLYKSGIAHWTNRSSPIASEQIEFERYKSECTFHPKTSVLRGD